MTRSIPNDEFLEIARHLAMNFSIFKKMWEISNIQFDNTVKTACVRFDKNSKLIGMFINPEFWDSLCITRKAFLISHECLHVILQHARRAKGLGGFGTRLNIAADIVCNERLITRYNFIREVVDPHNKFVWCDKYFDSSISTDESLEFYYKNLPEHIPETNDSEFLGGHDASMDQDQVSISDILKELSITGKEINELKDIIGDRALAGIGDGSEAVLDSSCKKNKLISVIKKLVKRKIKDADVVIDSWFRKPRRLHSIVGVNLPCEIDIEDNGYQSDYNVIMYIDLSGSCRNYHKAFNNIANYLKKSVEVRVFGFTTKVREIKNNIATVNGGTSFRAITEHFKTIDPGRCDVIVLTDGYGDRCSIVDNLSNWHWFITPDGSRDFIPEKCKAYCLDDYLI